MDEILDRTYQAGRAALNAGLDRGFRRIGNSIGKSFEALHRIQWSAPWAGNSRDVRCG